MATLFAKKRTSTGKKRRRPVESAELESSGGGEVSMLNDTTPLGKDVAIVGGGDVDDDDANASRR